jgi:pimeloyl-ACP methyl ester carboxylesterase
MHARRWASRQLCYVCTWHQTRGVTVCRNGLGAPLAGLDGLDTAVLGQIKRDVLAPDVFGDVVTRALVLWNGDGDEDPREALEREAARIEAEIARYAEAIGHGGSIPELVAALTARRRRLGEVRAGLGRLDGRRCDVADVLPDLRDQLTDWQGLLDQEPAAARQLLRKILEGRFVLTPRITPEGLLRVLGPGLVRAIAQQNRRLKGLRAWFLLESGMHTDRTLALRGQTFHFTEWGRPASPAVVLLHGVTGHARTWDDEAEALAGRFRVLALDQRGHGDSDPAPDGDYTVATMAEDLAAFADAQALGRFSIVGLSMGGRVAIAFAGHQPRRVDGLVVVDIGPDIAPDGRLRVGTLMASTPERFASTEEALAFARAANPRYTDAMLRHRVLHGTRRVDGGLVWKYDRALREAVRAGRWRDPIDLWPLWQAITCPVLLVRGADSDVLAPETAKRMLETNPRARLVEVPGAGHTVPGDQPETFRRLLAEFLGA